MIVDQLFFLTILLIFVAAITSIFLKRRVRDNCLMKFQSLPSCVQLKAGSEITGNLIVFVGGIELEFLTTSPFNSDHSKSSRLIFEEQFNEVQRICVFHKDLDEKQQEERAANLELVYKPGFFPRNTRKIKNLINTFQDAFQQTLGIALNRISKTQRFSQVGAHSTKLQEIGGNVLNYAGNAYEPMLEKYVGYRVVAKEKAGDAFVDQMGILLEYNQDWLVLLDCQIRKQIEYLNGSTDQANQKLTVDISLEEVEVGNYNKFKVEVTNNEWLEVRIKKIKIGDWSHPCDQIIDFNSSTELGFDDLSEHLKAQIKEGSGEPLDLLSKDLILEIEVLESADLLLKRSQTIVTHSIQ